MSGPLAGLRVVEIAHDIAGPYCTKLLVDLGADVYKIEPPDGDPLRRWGPFPGGVPDPERSGLFEYINAGKHGARLDLARQEDGAAARELIGAADILVDSLGPGTLDRSRWGLDREGLSRLNPGLVVVRISDFGQDGPLRDRETTPLTIQAAAGWVSLRDQDRPPVQAGARISEFVAGAYAALGALTAMRPAANPGELIEVDVSTFESLVSTLPYPMLMAERMKRQGRPANSKAGPMLGIVRAADGLVGVNCLTGQHWLDVCAMVGLPEFGEHQLAVMMGGPERGEFFAKAQPYFDEQTVADIVDLSQAMRIPAAPVSDGASIHACPQYADRKFFIDLQREGWHIDRPGSAFRLSKTPVEPPRPAPRLGSDEATPFARKAFRSEVEAAADALPFDGLKILDLTTFWAGAYLTCYLGAFGADVMKVESIQRPDGFRYSGAQVGETDWYERGPLWQAANLNKRDITLDLTSDRGRELALALVAEADVVVENFSPRVVEHFGMDYESLAAVNPDIVMVRMPGFGLVGPWRDYVGWALNFEQVSGMAGATGYPDGPPCDLQGPADPIAGVHATIALLSALEHRRRTGEGQLVEIAQIEACAAVAAQPVIEYSVTGVVPEREGNRHRVYAQGVYPASDATWVALSVRDDTDWAALVDAIGRPELLNDRRFGTAEQRRSNHDAFDEVIAEWTRASSPDEIVDALSARGVPAERLMTPGRMYDIPQLDARDYYQELVHPLTGPHRFPGWPIRISPGPTQHHRSAPPTLGQHNAEVLTAMGVSDQEIAELREAGVIGERLRNG